MEAKELRIGNWVLVENDHETIKAITQTAFLCVLDGKGDGHMQLHKDVYPIPLTEEWLIKFGFKFKSYGYGEEEWKQWTFSGYSLNGFRCTTSGVELKYVHQLQNLYFTLTGEELNTQN